jgi:glucose-6-phosphate dehydrogenase assembly protein OpcA
MEDVVSKSLVIDGTDVKFSEIEAALARTEDASGSSAPARARTATLVAIGPEDRLKEAVEPLRQLGESGAVRPILVLQNSSAVSKIADNLVVLGGLSDRHVDNAVAALRLSSLPTLVWWRGGSLETLDGLANLADRIVLDADPPEPAWQRALGLVERTAFSDLRWTRLTRWRTLTAQFFDVPELRGAVGSLDRLRVEGADRSACTLFAAWVKTVLKWKDNAAIEIRDSGRDAPIESIALAGSKIELTLRLAPSRRCVETSATVGDPAFGSRFVSLGDQSVTALLTEELCIRSRDEPFERAVRAAVGAV